MLLRFLGLTFFLFVVGSTFATSFSSMQFGGSVYRASYSTSTYDWASSTTTDANHDVTLTAVGINITTFYGDEFGILGTTNLQFSPLAGTNNAKAIDVSDYDLTLSESGLVGIGYKFERDFADFVVGGGPHFSAIMLNARWKPYEESAGTESINTGVNVGLGAVVLMKMQVFSNLYFVSTMSIGYDFFSIANFDNYRNVRMVESSISSGLGVSH